MTLDAPLLDSNFLTVSTIHGLCGPARLCGQFDYQSTLRKKSSERNTRLNSAPLSSAGPALWCFTDSLAPAIHFWGMLGRVHACTALSLQGACLSCEQNFVTCPYKWTQRRLEFASNHTGNQSRELYTEFHPLSRDVLFCFLSEVPVTTWAAQ